MHPAEKLLRIIAYIALAVILFLFLFPDLAIFFSLSSSPGYAFGFLFAILVPLVLGFISFLLIVYIRKGVFYADIRINGIRITPTQFPEAYEMIAEAAHQAGLREIPDAYVVEGDGQINAFVSGHGRRKFVAIYSDLFEVGGVPNSVEALRFVIGHEIGHIAAGHTHDIHAIVTALMKLTPLGMMLSRAQEYTADNYAYAFCPEGAPKTMSVLGAGKKLYKDVNFDELADRASQDRSLFVILANQAGTHPPLTWRSHALRDRSRPGNILFPPYNNQSYHPYNSASTYNSRVIDEQVTLTVHNNFGNLPPVPPRHF